MRLGADGLNMLRSRANRWVEGNVAPAVRFPSLHRFGNCFKSEDTIVMDLAACVSTAEANCSAVFRARFKETAPDSARQIFTDHLRAIEDDQP
ncbi:MAG: hypothetical protein QOF94_192 [Acidobacteriaceae bacterium]|jgi:hypothetical protein